MIWGANCIVFGRKIEGLEARLDSQAAEKAAIDLARDNYHAQTAKIEHFMKDNAWLKQKVQSSLSPACSPRKPVTKRILVN